MEATQPEDSKTDQNQQPETEVTLEQLIDREDIIQELRNQNRQIEKHLHYKNYKRLIGFIVRPGPPEDQRLSYKFPFLVSDILCLELKDLSDCLFKGEQPLIKQLFSFLQGEENYILASYFSKIMNTLLKRMHKPGVKYDQQLCKWLFQENYVLKFIDHLYSRSMVEPILRILTLKSKNNEFMAQKMDIVQHLAKMLEDPEQNDEFLDNIALIFESLIVNDFSQKIHHDLAKITFSKEILSLILTGIGSSSSVRKFKFRVINTYLKQFRMLGTEKEADQQLKSITQEFRKSKQGLELFEQYSNSLLDFLKESAQNNSRAGLQIIALIDTLENFLLLTSVSRLFAMAISKHLPSLYKLLRVNCWNNILHSSILKITDHLAKIFKGSPSDMVAFLDIMVGILLNFSHIFEKEHDKKTGYVGYILEASQLILTLVSTYAYEKSQEWSVYETSLQKMLAQIRQLQVGEYKVMPYYLPIVFERESIRKTFKQFLSHEPQIEYNESKAQKEREYEELKNRKIEELIEKESTPAEIAKFEVEEEFETYKYWKENLRLKYDLQQLMDDI